MQLVDLFHSWVRTNHQAYAISKKRGFKATTKLATMCAFIAKTKAILHSLDSAGNSQDERCEGGSIEDLATFTLETRRKRDAAQKGPSIQEKVGEAKILGVNICKSLVMIGSFPNRSQRRVDSLAIEMIEELLKKIDNYSMATRMLVLERLWIHNSLLENHPTALGCQQLDQSLGVGFQDLKGSLHIIPEHREGFRLFNECSSVHPSVRLQGCL